MIIKDGLIGHNLATIFNTNGHRCKELAQLNTKNYILFAGGNAGVAIDTPIEQTYPYIVSKNCRLDYYNLCVSSGGIDTLRYNLLIWYKNFPPPKALVINCEFLQGQLISDPVFSFIEEANTEDEEVQEIYRAGTACYYYNAKRIIVDKLLSYYIQGIRYQIVSKDETELFTKKVINIINDDDKLDHQLIGDTISADLNSKLLRARP